MHLYALWRGFQSALFYYLSCMPWLNFMARRRRRRAFNRPYEENVFMDANMQVYRQPAAYTTNPFWTEEIRLGPGPPPRSLTRKQRSALERLKTRDSFSTATTPTDDRTKCSVTLSGLDDSSRSILGFGGESWHPRQRPDEPLWGLAAQFDGSRPLPTIMQSEDGPVSPEIKPEPKPLSIEAPFFKNPRVTELHPPVVSKLSHATTSNMWMLQPPAPAAMMAGKHQLEADIQTLSSMSSRRNCCGGRDLRERLDYEQFRRQMMLYDEEDDFDTTPQDTRDGGEHMSEVEVQRSSHENGDMKDAKSVKGEELGDAIQTREDSRPEPGPAPEVEPETEPEIKLDTATEARIIEDAAQSTSISHA